MININIKQAFSGIELVADTITMQSILTIPNPIHFKSELNKVLGFTNTHYSEATHKSEKPVMKTTTEDVHLNCDCVDGPVLNGTREQILFSFNLGALPV